MRLSIYTVNRQMQIILLALIYILCFTIAYEQTHIKQSN